MEPSTGAQRAFAVRAFYKNGDSFVIAQREFRREFGIHRNRAVPSAHAIKTWVRNFKATGSTLKKKVGSVKTVSTPENIVVVREAIERSPHRSARRHSGCLKPAFDGFYTKIFISTLTKFKLRMHYMNVTM
jgi:transposase